MKKLLFTAFLCLVFIFAHSQHHHEDIRGDFSNSANAPTALPNITQEEHKVGGSINGTDDPIDALSFEIPSGEELRELIPSSRNLNFSNGNMDIKLSLYQGANGSDGTLLGTYDFQSSDQQMNILGKGSLPAGPLGPGSYSIVFEEDNTDLQEYGLHIITSLPGSPVVRCPLDTEINSCDEFGLINLGVRYPLAIRNSRSFTEADVIALGATATKHPNDDVEPILSGRALPSGGNLFVIYTATSSNGSMSSCVQRIQIKDTGIDPMDCNGSLSISDACNCDEEGIIRNDQGEVTHFRETLLLDTEVAGKTIELLYTGGNLLDENLDPIPVNTVLGVTTADGDLTLEYYVAAGANIDIDLGNGSKVWQLTSSACRAIDCPLPEPEAEELPAFPSEALWLFAVLVLGLGLTRVIKL